MFKKILVCDDGTGPSWDAAQTAAAIAFAFCSEVIVLTVSRAATEMQAAEHQPRVRPEVSRLFEMRDIPFRYLLEQNHRTTADTILQVAEREKPDLIVEGCRGLRGVSELVLGSVSSSVLHHAKCPVLIARGYNAPCGTEGFDNIMLASDGSPFALDAARVAVRMAQRFRTPLTILNVYEELSSATVPGDKDRLIDRAESDTYSDRWLEYVAKPVREFANDEGVMCSFVQKGGKPADTVISFANVHEVDLIVVGSRGLGNYSRLLMGSVSDRIAHYANCPVLVVR